MSPVSPEPAEPESAADPVAPEPTTGDVVVRRARTSDVPRIKELIDKYAGRILLEKNLVTLYESVQEFWVGELDGQVVGCGALHVLWADLGEVRTVAVDPRLLFRFSALTYNAHRIHYDAVWNREREGLDGLVVHGPLQALLMAELGSEVLPHRVTTFRYRLRAPLLHHEGMHVLALLDPTGEVDVRVVDDAGRVTATAHLG